jgi:ABC-type phosphate transport system substrate-binding protein
MASYSAAILALVCSVLLASASAQQFGGATSVTNYIGYLIGKYNTAHGKSIPTYAAVGSSAGIAGFDSAEYAVGFSDDPMTAAQDAAAPRKLTLPLTLGTYSFVTRYHRGLRASGPLLAKIYLGQITKWDRIKKGGKGFVIPVCRSDGSGTTGLITTYFSQVYSGWPSSFIGNNPLNVAGNPFNKRLVGQSGSGGVAAYIVSNHRSLGYVQSGIGITQYKAYGMAISNPAGKFVFAVDADPTQSIPRTLPPYTASWAAVSLINKVGAGTYPIASFVYMFARRNYKPTSFNSVASVVRSFLVYTQTNAAANAGGQFFFYTIPSSIRQKTTAAIRKIHL